MNEGRDPAPEGAGEPAEARKAFLLRLPPALLADLRRWAGEELRSLNAHLEFVLRQALERRRHGPQASPAGDAAPAVPAGAPAGPAVPAGGELPGGDGEPVE